MKIQTILTENELAKPLVAKAAANIVLAGFVDPLPQITARVTNLPEKDVQKYLGELSKKRTIPSYATEQLSPLLHRLVVAIMYYKYNQNKRSVEDIESFSGMPYNDFIKALTDNYDVLNRQVTFKVSAFPKQKKLWRSIDPATQADVLRKEIPTIAGHQHQKLSAVDVAKHLIHKYVLGDEPGSLARRVDELLEKLPELDRFRMLGRFSHG